MQAFTPMAHRDFGQAVLGVIFCPRASSACTKIHNNFVNGEGQAIITLFYKAGENIVKIEQQRRNVTDQYPQCSAIKMMIVTCWWKGS